MKPHISMITLGVSDLIRSAAFYRDGLGLPANEDFPGVVFFQLKGAWLSLYPLAELAADAKASGQSEGFGGFTLAHNVASREEVDAVMEQARNAGARISRTAHETDWGGYSGYFADPDGYLWEVAWNPHFDLT